MREKPSAEDVHAGQAVYSRSVLSAYDLFVLGFSCRFIWRCPKKLVRHFDEAEVTERGCVMLFEAGAPKV